MIALSFIKDVDEIINYAHMWNWVPDWDIVKTIYNHYPDSFSVLAPFAYTYLEEMIRSTTSEYGRELLDGNGKPKKRKVGKALMKLAIDENRNKQPEYVVLLEEIKGYFSDSTALDEGDNRNSVVHGYMHPRFWSKESFEKLINDISRLSKYSGF